MLILLLTYICTNKPKHTRMILIDKFNTVKTPIYFKNTEEFGELATRGLRRKGWHFNFLGLENLPGDGRGIKTAILDSGVNVFHPTLEGANIETVKLSQYGTFRSGEHGTFVASLLAGNGTKQVHGIAKKGEYYSIPVLSPSGFGSVDKVVKGLHLADELGVDFINMSFGTRKPSRRLTKIINKLTNKGVVIVCAGGNSGIHGGVMHPAKHGRVISVGSVNSFGEISSFSSTEDLGDIDIVAPGDQIYGALNGKGSGRMSGTSFAAPIVTGVSMALKSAGYSVNKEILELAATDLRTPGLDEYSGFGLLDYRPILRMD